MTADITKLKGYFDTGATRTYDFRKGQLLRLREVIIQYETALQQALYTDLKKNAEEAWITEIGFVLSEISYVLPRLKKWMRPRKVRTNLLNFPSKSYVYQEPLGVVLVIAPWNYPFQLLFAPLVGAIAAGNCVVLKPSEAAPATEAVMQQIITAAFDPQYISYQAGEGATIVPQLINSFRFDHIFYTGSTGVGKAVYELAARQLIPVTLELGGKSPCVIESDADIKVAARRVAMVKFSNAGQMCVAPDYLLVHSSIKEAFLQELQKVIHTFFSENAATNYNYGKIINTKSFNRLVGYLQKGKILSGGQYDVTTHYIAPTLIEGLSMTDAVMGEEVFGPLLPVLPFSSFEEARAIIEKNRDPLAFYLFTQKKETEEAYLHGIAFGGGCINNAALHLTNSSLPFGGRGSSGIGAYHGRYSFDTFSHRKAVMKTPTWFDPAMKYPPYEGKLRWFRKLIR